MKKLDIVSRKYFAMSSSFVEATYVEEDLPLQTDLRIRNQFRSIFDRDRDRILNSKTFRRMNGKTQIFVPNTNDYIRTRLTHSIEVNQIARSMSKGLGLDLSLTEAIALGHDVGHTPFGHAGEYELNRIMNNCYSSTSDFELIDLLPAEKGFKHNFQSIRVICELSDLFKLSSGLGISNFTLWGILNHTRTQCRHCEYFQEGIKTWISRGVPYVLDREKIREIELTVKGINKIDFDTLPINRLYISSNPEIISDNEIANLLDIELNDFAVFSSCNHNSRKKICFRDGDFSLDFYKKLIEKYNFYSEGKPAWSLEGIVVAVADEIAQIHHDIEDSIYMGIISLKEAKKLIEDVFSEPLRKIKDPDSRDNYQNLLDGAKKSTHPIYFMNNAGKLVVDYLISDIILNSQNQLYSLAKEFNINSNVDFITQHEEIGRKIGIEPYTLDILQNEIIRFDPLNEISPLREEFGYRVINSEEVQKLNNLGSRIILDLFRAFYGNPKILPDGTVYKIARQCEGGKEILRDYHLLNIQKEYEFESRLREALGSTRSKMNSILRESDEKRKVMRIICDHIAGMTDKYALLKHNEIYGTKFDL